MNATSPWPPLDRLERFSGFLARLASLPEQVGPIDLGRLRDTRLPLPDLLLPRESPISCWDNAIPHDVDSGWLADALLQSAETLPFSLLDIARQVRIVPEWTLTAIWLLESALAWPTVLSASQQGALLGELGDLYCQTGDIIQGVQLLDDGRFLRLDDLRSWHCALRAARWIALINPGAATDRLQQLQGESAPVAIRLQAGLELLDHQLSPPRGPESSPDVHALLEHARQADELVLRAGESGLDAADVSVLRLRANHLVGRWFGASRIRPLREEGLERLLAALHECSQVDDFRSLAQILDSLGRAHLRLGSFRHARENFAESIALKQKLRDLWGLGTSLTGMAECLLASGQTQQSLACFQVNLLLLENLGGMQVLFVRNLARHLNALVAAGCDPLEISPPAPELLVLAKELLARYVSFVPNGDSDPYCLLLGGGYRRLAARNAGAVAERFGHLATGVRQVEQARDLFTRQGNWLRVAEANRTLAALLLDRAVSVRPGALDQAEQDGQPALSGNSNDPNRDLSAARRALEEAEHHHQGEAGRVQAELLWARYQQLAGTPYQMQLHLAAARRAAEASGYHALALGVDARLGVRLTGPTGTFLPAARTPDVRTLANVSEPDEVVVVALPGETIVLEVRASDWRDRPLSASVLHGVIEPEEGPCPTITPTQVRTDHLGRARFHIHAKEVSRSVFRAATPDGVHSLSLRVVARPTIIEWADLSQATPSPGEDAQQSLSRLLRQLFGPTCSRLRITRRFTSGHSGTRVLLVEPFLQPGPSPVQNREDNDNEMRGQPCIVKLGPRSLLEDERRRYLRWVKDLLPVNISRLDGFTVWHDSAALRMSLVGDISRAQVREAREWLAGASAFDAHLLLERVFVGDLAACWYGNSPRKREAEPIEELYGPMVPRLLHLADSSPPAGFRATGPPLEPIALAEGLRPAPARSFHIGDRVAVGEATLLGYRETANGWEYELQSNRTPLRFAFRTPLSPEFLELDGADTTSTPVGAVSGIVESTAHDRLDHALRACCAVFNETHANQRVTFSDDERFLLVQTQQISRRLPNPLDHLARLLATALPCNWSLIHGDLHGRNILVGPQGQPFYIDFARTGYGPTLFDFIKFEVYLWHECFAGWPHGDPPPECNLTQAMRLLEEFSSADPARHFPSPYARQDGKSTRATSGDRYEGAWSGLFRQCLATLRSAARPHVVDAGGRDYFLPLALYTGLMLRWCDPSATTDGKQQVRLCRQGVIHALASASLLAGVLG